MKNRQWAVVRKDTDEVVYSMLTLAEAERYCSVHWDCKVAHESELDKNMVLWG